MHWKRSVALVASFAALGCRLAANDFFAMDTIAKGPPGEVVTLLRELGYDGLGGTALDPNMPEALRAQGLQFYAAYIVLRPEAVELEIDEKLIRWFASLHGHKTFLWVAIAPGNGPAGGGSDVSDPAIHAVVVKRLQHLAEAASEHQIGISLYPHAGFWMPRFDDAVRLATAIGRPNVGVTFNLCHWLKVEGADRDPVPAIRAALPQLQFVTISGADAGDTRNFGWERLIRPLDAGTYDLAGFVANLLRAGYRGPIGFQGYGIRLKPEEALKRSMAAWKTFSQVTLSPVRDR